MYTLYYSPGTASMATHMALIEIGASFELQLVDFESKAQKSDAYVKLNPMGQVPTLVIDGQPYTESAAILMMLADRHPDAGLAPAPGTAARNEFYQWLVFFSNALGATLRHWYYPDDLGAPEHSPVVKAAINNLAAKAWDRLDKHLGSAGPYLLGEQFSAADLHLIMHMRWSRDLPKTALEWPALREYATLMRSRKSWQEMCDVEGLEEWRGP